MGDIVGIKVRGSKVTRYELESRKTAGMQFKSHKIVGITIYLSVVIGCLHKIRVRYLN